MSEELKQHLNLTMTENYAQPGKEDITVAVDRLQQDVRAGVLGCLLRRFEAPGFSPLPAPAVQVLRQQQLW